VWWVEVVEVVGQVLVVDMVCIVVRLVWCVIVVVVQ
jgi:hypothetical protein